MATKKRDRKSRPNRGGHFLKRTGVAQSEIARTIGVTQGAVAQYIGGLAKPNAEVRQAILRGFGVPIATWDQELAASNSADDGPEVATAKGTVHTFEQTAEDLQQLIQRGIARIRNDPNATPGEESKTLRDLTSTLGQLGKITGEHAANMARILSHPEFRRAVSTIVDALRPYPEAAGAAATALRRLEGE